MTKTIRMLVATDGSDPGHRAVEWCADMAQYAEVEVVAVHVVSRVAEWLMSVAQIDYQRIEAGRRALLDGRWTEPLRRGGIHFRSRLLVGDPVDDVLTAAAEEHADMIVIGTTGHGGVGGLGLGGIATKLAHKTTCPLVLVPEVP